MGQRPGGLPAYLSTCMIACASTQQEILSRARHRDSQSVMSHAHQGRYRAGPSGWSGLQPVHPLDVGSSSHVRMTEGGSDDSRVSVLGCDVQGGAPAGVGRLSLPGQGGVQQVPQVGGVAKVGCPVQPRPALLQLAGQRPHQCAQ